MADERKRKGHNTVEYCPGFTDANGIWNNGFPCPRWGAADISYCCGYEQNRFCCPEPEDDHNHGNSHNGGNGGGNNSGGGGVEGGGDDGGGGGGGQVEPDGNGGAGGPSSPDSNAGAEAGGEPSLVGEHLPLIAGACAGVILLFIIILVACLCTRKCSCCRRRAKTNRGGEQCPGCRHQQGQVPVVIANENGDVRQCTLGECPPAMAPTDPSYCSVCREDGLRWQLGMTELDSLYPLDDPPPYTLDEEDKDNEGKRRSQQQYGSTFRSFVGSQTDISGTSSPLIGQTSLTRDSRTRDPREGSAPRMTIIRTDGGDGRPKYVMAPKDAIQTGSSNRSISGSTERTVPKMTSSQSKPGGLRHSLLLPSEEGPDVIPRH